jgi:DNA-directed RNA polymerase specialized sigma24 family protein
MTTMSASRATPAQIMALRPDLMAFAARHASDESEAERLVSFVLGRALDEPAPRIDDIRAWLFAMMRGAFHSVERRRGLNRTQRIPDRLWNAAQAAVYAAIPRTPT